MDQITPVKIYMASPVQALAVWTELQERIRKALSRAAGDSWSEEQLFKHVLLGPGKMMVAERDGDVLGCLIIEFLERDRGKCLYVLASAGIDHRSWSGEMNAVLVDLARFGGCYCLEAFCADGVERVIEKYGWHRKAVLMEMTL